MAEKYMLYEYDKEGYHTGGLEISDNTLEMVFRTVVKVAKEEKREIVITDMGDDCVFHMKDGEILFPTPEMYADASK